MRTLRKSPPACQHRAKARDLIKGVPVGHTASNHSVTPPCSPCLNIYRLCQMTQLAEWSPESESWIMPKLNVTDAGGSLDHLSPGSGRRGGYTAPGTELIVMRDLLCYGHFAVDSLCAMSLSA